MIKQIYHCKNKGQKREIYILATEMDEFCSDPPHYGDILALFDTLDEAEEVRGKLERGEEVDFIDMGMVGEGYDRFVIFSLPLNEKVGTKLAIFLSGGLVQGIVSNKPLLKPIVIDCDTEGSDEANGDNIIEWVWEEGSRICDRESWGVVTEPELEVNFTLVDCLYGLYYRKEGDGK